MSDLAAHPSRLLRDVKMRDLRIVLAVAEQGGILKAAQHINITQPTVTRCVQGIESRLGVALFRRTSRGMVPTVYGDAFVRRCRGIMADIGALGAEIDTMAHGVRGQVLIGAMPAAMNSFLPLALLELQKSHPDIRVSVSEGNENDLLLGLRNRNIDLAVGRLPSEREHPDVRNEVLLNDPLCFVARPGHPLFSQPTHTVAQACEFPWVCPNRESLVQKALESAFRTAGHELPRVAIYTTSITCIAEVVAGSDYIGPLPESMFHFGTKPAGIARLQIDLRSTLAPIGITRLRGKDMLPVTAKVEEVLRQFCIP